MRLNLWTEIRTAAQVARLGRVSAAAEILGMHHASVIRHIDTLEAELGVKLFQRHARGYTPTEAGQELLHTATLVDEQFVQMRARLEAARHEISGRLVLTVVPGLVDVMLPVIRRYLLAHPKVQLVFSADQRNYELSRGEAHVALRAGPRPAGLDNVVSRAFDWTHALFAAPSYIQKYGQPAHLDELPQHRFIGGEDGFGRVTFNQWLDSRVPEEAFALRTPQSGAAYRAIRDGLGIGFLGRATAWPEMVELFPDCDPPEWRVAVWMVTHVDLHRSPKVQSLTRFIHDEMQAHWHGGTARPADVSPG